MLQVLPVRLVSVGASDALEPRGAKLVEADKTHWQTPAVLLDLVGRVAPIALDPCTTRDNPTGATVICVEHGPMPGDGAFVYVDGLAEQNHWPMLARDGLLYCNPPYGRGIGAWVDRCADAGADGAECIALVPASVDTRWWAACTPPTQAQAVCFWRGRLTFVGAPQGAKFASAVIYYGPRKYRFADAFAGAGAIWI